MEEEIQMNLGRKRNSYVDILRCTVLRNDEIRDDSLKLQVRPVSAEGKKNN